MVLMFLAYSIIRIIIFEKDGVIYLMEQLSTALIMLKNNLPLIIISMIAIYILMQNIFNKFNQDNSHDIDELIRKKRQLFSSSQNTNQTSNAKNLKEYLRSLHDSQIDDLLKAIEWGDKLPLPNLAIPFANDKSLLEQHLRRILVKRVDKQITVTTLNDLINYLEQQINFSYLSNPIPDFPHDDFLTACRLLGVPQNTQKPLIKKRFHLLSQKFHPDKFNTLKKQLTKQQQKNINHNYKQIQLAYEILSKR